MICPICKVRWAPYPKIDWSWAWDPRSDKYFPVEKITGGGAENRRQMIIDNDTLLTCMDCSL